MKKLIQLLIKMEQEDYDLRQDILTRGQVRTGYHDELRHLHEGHVKKLLGTFEREGWPKLRDLSDDAREALFFIALHAISQPQFVKGVLTHFLGDKHKQAPAFVAHLEDRIAFFERRPQTYGTQWDMTLDGETVLWPLGDESRLNDLRRNVGLDPFEEIDFALVDMDLGMGLNRQVGQYRFIYTWAWLDWPCDRVKTVIEELHTYASGFIFGPAYSLAAIKNQVDQVTNIDLIMPDQHREAFEDFVLDQGITTLKKGRKVSDYAIGQLGGQVSFSVRFAAFLDTDKGWVIDEIGLPVDLATHHSAQGWVLSKTALLKAIGKGWMDVSKEDQALLVK